MTARTVMSKTRKKRQRPLADTKRLLASLHEVEVMPQLSGVQRRAVRWAIRHAPKLPSASVSVNPRTYARVATAAKDEGISMQAWLERALWSSPALVNHTGFRGANE